MQGEGVGVTGQRSRLAVLRREAGLTQQQLADEIAREAARLGVAAAANVRQVRRWERKIPPPLPHPAQQLLLETIFGVPLHEMGFEVPEHRRRASSVSDDEEVRRRNFVTASGGIAAAALLPVPAEPIGVRVGVADVRRLQAEVAELFEVDHRLGSIPAQVRARRLEQQITTTLNTASVTGRVGRSLQTMAAELACHRAWFSYDGARDKRRLAAARGACTEAITAAQLVENPLLQVRALNSLSLIAVEAGHHWEARSAVERAEALARRAGAGPTVRLVVALREAGAATHAGDLVTGKRALSRATGLLTLLGRDHEVPRWVRFAGPVEVDYATAAWYRRAGQPRQAVPWLRAAVNGLGGGYARNAAWYRTRLAQALLEADEVEEACHEVTEVLDACGQVASRRLRRRLGDFADAAALTGAAAAHGPVERIRDVLRAA